MIEIAIFVFIYNTYEPNLSHEFRKKPLVREFLNLYQIQLMLLGTRGKYKVG